MNRYIRAVAMAAFLLLGSSGALFAQALYEVSLDEKVQASPLIVEGKVLSQTPFWNKTHGVIFTSNKIEVYKVFKGTVSTQYIEVLTQGGTIGDISIWATDLLTLEKDQVGTFFCHPNVIDSRSPITNSLLWEVYSSGQGFFNYDLQKQTANAPFVRYGSITNQLYPELQLKTGRAFENKNPLFSVGNFTPSPLNTTAPVISSFSPSNVNAGKLADASTNLLTINGSGFGTASGLAAVFFDDANDGTGGTAYGVSATHTLVQSWTPTQITIRVPSRAGTGTFIVRDDAGATGNSPSPLTVDYSILNLSFGTGQLDRMLSIKNQNGSGGMSYYYSISTAGSGVDFSTAPQKDPFERAVTTWKEVCGLNYSYAGTTDSQRIGVNALSAQNIIVMDNANTFVSPLAAGVLASCYFSGTSCTGTLYTSSYGFDILIRNAGVSAGSTTFNNGPCATATAGAVYDMESVLLHELGHSLGLGHINDSYISSPGYPNTDPGKLMNYAIVNGVDRRSPDWSSNNGALYCINPKGLVYGSCNTISSAAEMTPLATLTETKDECPVTFPTVSIPSNTLVAFDLNHATSNKTKDPQFTAVNCAGTGTGVTNTAYYALKTSNTGGTLTLNVTGYSTTPSTQAACSGAGVELALYQTASCPTGQAFPSPVACRTFNASGTLANFTGLTANTTYLIMVDGISNTRATFSLLFSGTAVPVKLAYFKGSASELFNTLSWKAEAIAGVNALALEGSTDGTHFTELYRKTVPAGANTVEDSYKDYAIAPVNYYRVKTYNATGAVEYSNILVLRHDKKLGVTIAPNPVKDYMSVSLYKQAAGSTSFTIFDAAGKQLASRKYELPAGQQSLQLDIASRLVPGTYVLQVNDGGNSSSHRITKL